MSASGWKTIPSPRLAGAENPAAKEPSVTAPGVRMAVVIISWNTRELLRDCLASVLMDAAAEIVVVDNGSTDGSIEMVRRKFPSVSLEVLPSNPGYGAGCNAGVRACRAEYVLLLNSDTVLRPGTLAAMTGVLDREKCAAVIGPRIISPDGSLQPSCYPFPSPYAVILKREPFATVVALLPWLRETYIGRWSYDRQRRVPWVMGAALAVRRTAFEEVGGFDESFVMYFEEVDLCYRLRIHGWDTFFTPLVDVIHVGGASTRQRRSEMIARYNFSLIHFHRRHHRGAMLRMGLGVVRGSAAARLLRDTVRYYASFDRSRRARLAEDVAVWREVLSRASQGT
jgi:GT2 family glycosyltransferase